MVRYQQLESRIAFNASVELSGSRLLITGTSRADTVAVELIGRSTLRVSTDQHVFDFLRSRVRTIVVRLGAGNDVLKATDSPVRFDVNAGAGNDTILTGSGEDTIFAGSGNDSIRAGAGRDLIYAGDGNDTRVGEAGSDTLFGELGDDSIIGGLDYDVVRGGIGRDRFVIFETYTTEVFDYSPRLDVPV